MSVFIPRPTRGYLLRGSAIAAALSFATAAAAQNQLPEVVVTAPKEQPFTAAINYKFGGWWP